MLLPQLADIRAVEGPSGTDAAELPPVGYGAKMVVFAAGAVFNVLFAFALACVIWIAGQPENSETATTQIGYVSSTLDLPDGSKVPSPASEAGLQVGDVIRAIDGRQVSDWTDVMEGITTSSGRDANGRPRAVFTIERSGRRFDVTLFPRLAGDEKYRRVGILPAFRLLVHQVEPHSLASQAGFEPGDDVVSLDGVPMMNNVAFGEYLQAAPARAVVARVLRAGREVALAIAAADRDEARRRLRPHVRPRIPPIPSLALRASWANRSRSRSARSAACSTATPTSGCRRWPDPSASCTSSPTPRRPVFGSCSCSRSWSTSTWRSSTCCRYPSSTADRCCSPQSPGCAAAPSRRISSWRRRASSLLLIFSMILYMSYFDVRRWARDVQAERADQAAAAERQAMSYCASRFRTVRRRTAEVRVGEVGVGGDHPIRIQSMTTSDTQDVPATVRQAVALAEVGCEIVRVTAPNVPAARCLRDIRAQFTAAGFGRVPLVADIHFLPTAAMEAVEHVEKVRVNPGNYADKKKFAVREYSDADYERELQRLHDAFSPLVKRCRELGRALRIGTNHGSLSDRIMNRYGDTPLGMVESALEFLRIAESHGFRRTILSMKASNPKVMIEAYRLLVERMDGEDMHYPLHLGVTEAGDGEDGRIKGAIGIGSLLLDGLGDTIRVSLTEDSVYEIPVARAIADKAMSLWRGGPPREPAPPAAGGSSRSVPFHAAKGLGLHFAGGCAAGAAEPPRVIVRVDAGDLPRLRETFRRSEAGGHAGGGPPGGGGRPGEPGRGRRRHSSGLLLLRRVRAGGRDRRGRSRPRPGAGPDLGCPAR